VTYLLKFYRTERDDVPALDYIKSQKQAHRTRIGRALRELQEIGHLARRPLVDYVGAGLYELRISFDGLQHRLLYFFHARTIIVVTSGFLKNTERIPAAELRRAQNRRRDWMTNFGDRS
jgi:phage-related protein